MDIHTPGGFIEKVCYISRTGVYKRTKPINFTYLSWYATQDISCSVHMCAEFRTELCCYVIWQSW